MLDKALLCYVLLPKRMVERLFDVKVEEKVEEFQTIFWLKLAEIGRWMEECREDGGCEKCVEGE